MPRARHPRRTLALVAPLLALTIAAALLPRPAAAATCTVTSVADSGANTLRAAVNNTDGYSNCDSITFALPGAAPWAITLTSGELAIARSLAIAGPGADRLVVSGNNASRVFRATAGTVAISDLTIANGSADYGGGVFSSAALTVARVAVVNNAASTVGGGLSNVGGTLTVADSTISGNRSPQAGGVNNEAGSATLTNCTIAGNSGGNGGGVRAVASPANVTTTLSHCTVAGNTGFGIFTGTVAGTATLRLQSSVVAGNTVGDFGSFGIVARTSLGHNVVGDATGAAFLTGPGDANGTSPLLDPAGLAANGGPTRTIALQPASPAIDRVPASGANCPAADQRGVPRPRGVACDSGAYEATVVATTLAAGPAAGPYGGTVTLVATLAGPGGPLAGRTVAFALNGAAVGTAVTDASGVATLNNVPLGTTPVGTAPAGVGADFGGAAPYLPSSATAALTVGRRILWVRPVAQTVARNAPNPPATPPANCLASQTPTEACWLRLVAGSFLPGDDWSSLGIFRPGGGGLRFTYARNPTAPGFAEAVGATYKIAAIGLASPNYDVRYLLGTLTVGP